MQLKGQGGQFAIAASRALEQTREFWNGSPCGAQESFSTRRQHRYRMEPWIPRTLRTIAARHCDVLEVGCGQGTDGLVLCSLMGGGSYLGIDYSDASVNAARTSAAEARSQLAFTIEPQFRQGNAEALGIEDASIDLVYSCGVLHHTPGTEAAIGEVHRVLRPGGEAFIALYRKPSLKVGVAKALRAFQSGVDRVSGRNRTLYHLLRGRHFPQTLGTMLLEGFGVPVMKWYSHAGMCRLFGAFDILAIESVGYNLPFFHAGGDGRTSLGYMWLAHVRKRNGGAPEAVAA